MCEVGRPDQQPHVQVVHVSNRERATRGIGAERSGVIGGGEAGRAPAVHGEASVQQSGRPEGEHKHAAGEGEGVGAGVGAGCGAGGGAGRRAGARREAW